MCEFYFRSAVFVERGTSPGNQTVVALLRDADDELLIVRRGHSPHAHHDLDAVAGALALGTVEEADNSGPVRELETLLAELLHHGIKNLGADWRNRAQALTARLRSQSLFVLGRALETLTHEATRAAANPEDCRLAPHLMHLAALTAPHGEAGTLNALG